MSMSKNEKYLLVVVVILIVIAVWMSQCDKKQEYYEVLPMSNAIVTNTNNNQPFGVALDPSNDKRNVLKDMGLLKASGHSDITLSLRFDIRTDGITSNSLEQLKQNYLQVWNTQYKIIKLINLWYYTNTINDTIIRGRLYYQFGGISVGFWNATFAYDTTTGLYSVLMNISNSASETYNGLSKNELINLTMYYPYVTTNVTTTTDYPKTIQDSSRSSMVTRNTNDAKLLCFNLNEIDNLKRDVQQDIKMLSDRHGNYFLTKYKNYFSIIDRHTL